MGRRSQGFAGIGAEQGMATQMRGDRQQAGGRQQVHALYQGSLGGVGGGQDQGASAAGRLPGQGQRAAYRAQFAGERELAGKLMAGQVRGRDLPGGGEDAQCDGEVEAAAFLDSELSLYVNQFYDICEYNSPSSAPWTQHT